MKPLRSHDIFVLLALLSYADEQWTYDLLGNKLGLSASQVYRSLERAESSHLFSKQMRVVRRPELLEFLSYGIRYAFPATPGPTRRGVLTCWDAPEAPKPVSLSTDERYVWSSPSGTDRGQTIEPLHSSVSTVAGDDAGLYGLLALTDVLRVGSAREREMAREELEKRVL